MRRFSPADGLPASSIGSLCQDAKGCLWGATSAGAFCYDGLQFRTIGRRQGLPEAFIYSVAAGPDGTMWFGHETAGISYWRHGRAHALRVRGLKLGGVRYLWAQDGLPGHTVLWALPLPDPSAVMRLDLGPRDTTVTVLTAPQLGLPPAPLIQVSAGPKGQVWISGRGGVAAINATTLQLLPNALPPLLHTTPAGRFTRVSDDQFWLATKRGLLRLTRQSLAQPWALRWYGMADGLCADATFDVAVDAAARVWVFTADGIARLDGERFTCYGQPGGVLAGERAQALLADREGNLWIGQATGLTQHPADVRFTRFGPETDGLPTADVQDVASAGSGALWLATTNGLVRFNPNRLGAARTEIFPLPPHWRNSMVLRVRPDSIGGIWITGYQDGAAHRDAAGHWQELPLPEGTTLFDPTADKYGRLWFGSNDDGRLWVFDPKTQHLKSIQGAAQTSIEAMCPDPTGTIWVGTTNRGLWRLDTDRDTLLPAPGLPPENMSVVSMAVDSHGGLWLGLDGAQPGVYHYANGKLSKPLAGIETAPAFIQVRPHDLLIGSVHGLIVHGLSTGHQRFFSRADGFTGGECNAGAALLVPTGHLWFGTVNGLTCFDPSEHIHKRVAPHVTLTALRVGLRDTTVVAGLELGPEQNELTFGFVGICLAAPAQVRYQYRLRGLQVAWQPLTDRPSATFTNLAPGTYTFEVRAVNGEGTWSPQPALLPFTIRPPWWRTAWAGILYVSLAALGLWWGRRHIVQQERARAERELERRTLANLRELDRLKTDFFTNISHEFRTPLTLILGPAEQLRTENPDPATQDTGRLIGHQAQKLLTLINQLLDLSKLEAGALRLHPLTADVTATVRPLVAAFESLAESRGIRLHAELPLLPILLTFDPARLEEMLSNLLSNALKFTPASGEVVVSLLDTRPSSAAPQGCVEIAVRDSGPGIPQQEQARLFDRFYQVNDALPAGRPGTGVGLALVRELVTLHGGSITVVSAPGQGATFTLTLPRGALQAEPPTMHAAIAGTLSAAEIPIEPLSGLKYVRPETPIADTDAPVVLIVEDNADVRAFIETTLAQLSFHLLMAADGEAGLALARAQVPDLVVSDVMMPGTVNGYQLCAHLKADPATDHIPVVLLTARAAGSDKVIGLETGADAFVAKPFVPRELQAQVRNLLALRARVRERFAPPSPSITPLNGPISPIARPLPDPLAVHQAAVAALPSQEQVFLRKLEASIETHLDDETFGVEELAAKLALSRTQLHRKLKALTGQAPGDCIRQTRLLRAYALLQQRVGNVAEVGYRVGFSSPAYFSTAFTRQFGFPPSEVERLDI